MKKIILLVLLAMIAPLSAQADGLAGIVEVSPITWSASSTDPGSEGGEDQYATFRLDLEIRAGENLLVLQESGVRYEVISSEGEFSGLVSSRVSADLRPPRRFVILPGSGIVIRLEVAADPVKEGFYALRLKSLEFRVLGRGPKNLMVHLPDNIRWRTDGLFISNH